MMRARSWHGVSWPTFWRLGWPRLWRDRWRWLARRWAFALMGFVLGFLGVAGWHFETLGALQESEAQVQDLQEKLNLHRQSLEHPRHGARSGGPTAFNKHTGPPAVMAGWPVPGSQSEVWPLLERLVAHHGLRLLSLRPGPESKVGDWPSQAVSVRLQGRFDDWVAVWAAMNARGPVWGLERLRITPEDLGVTIDAVLRLWLSPVSSDLPSSAELAVPADLNGGSAQPVQRTGRETFVFVTKPLRSVTSAAVAAKLPNQEDVAVASKIASGATEVVLRDTTLSKDILSPDPEHWPLDRIRVGGVWQQAQSVQLILMAGPHWVLARLGQRIGQQGHVVDSIHAQEVHLRTEQGTVWVIGLDKAKP